MSRKELVSFLRKDKKRGWISYALFFALLFMLVNIYLIYGFQKSELSYLRFIRGAIPVPAIAVGNNIITMPEFEREMGVYRRLYANVYKVEFDKSGRGYNDINELRRFMQESLINRVILEDVAARFSVVVSDREVDLAIDELRSSIGTKEETLNLLRYSTGLRELDLRRMIYFDLLEDKFRDAVLFHVRIDGVAVSKDVEKLEESRLFIEGLRSDLAEGRISFDEARVKYGSQNADLSITNSWHIFGDIPLVFRDQLKDLKEGDVSGVITTDSSYFVLKLEESRGYFKGSYSDLIKNQRSSISIRSFLDID